MVAILAANAAGAAAAHASEFVTIPWSAAFQTNPGPNECIPYFPYFFGSTASECYVDFPLSIPAGRTIQQISVLHGTDNQLPVGQPYIEAYLEIVTLLPAAGDTLKFLWNSVDVVPSGTFDRHPLMAQFGKNYYDQFQVATYTTYHVLVALQNGAQVAGIEVIYY